MFNHIDILLDDQGVVAVVMVVVVVGCILGPKANIVLPRRSSRQREEVIFQFFGSIHGNLAMIKLRSLDPTDDTCRLRVACLISTSLTPL